MNQGMIDRVMVSSSIEILKKFNIRDVTNNHFNHQLIRQLLWIIQWAGKNTVLIPTCVLKIEHYFFYAGSANIAQTTAASYTNTSALIFLQDSDNKSYKVNMRDSVG